MSKEIIQAMRLILRFIILLFVCYLSACAVARVDLSPSGIHSTVGIMLDRANANTATDDCLEQVLESIKNKDKDALISIFSKNALSEAKDIEDRVDHLFDFVKGSVQSWEEVGYSSGAEIDKKHGKISECVNAHYTVITDVDEYAFYIMVYTTDTIDPNNAGLYILRTIRDADEVKLLSVEELLEKEKEGSLSLQELIEEEAKKTRFTWEEMTDPGIFISGLEEEN